MNLFKETITNFLHSFNNFPIGMSGKKITACFVVIFCFCAPIVTWTYWAYKHNDWSLLSGVLAVSASLIAGLFGINVLDKLKNPTETKDPNIQPPATPPTP